MPKLKPTASPTPAMDERPYHHGDLRNALIKEGRAALEEMPAHELTLRLVARRVGVSQAAPSRHFTGLNDLLASIAVEGFRELIAQRRRIAESDDGVSKKMQLMMRCYIEFARANRGMFSLMVGHRIVNQTDHRELHEVRRESFDLFAHSVCDHAREFGWKPEKMSLLIHAAWSTEHGAAVLINAERVPAFNYDVDLDQMVEFSLALLQSGIERGPASLAKRKG